MKRCVHVLSIGRESLSLRRMGMGVFQWLLCTVVMLLFFVTEAAPLKALYFFGSSYLDVGTNIFLNYTSDSNFLPFGETYFGHPTGRHSDGLILSDFIELKLGFPFLPPYLQPAANFTLGANFASSGSGILDSTNVNMGGPVISLRHQTQQFQSLIQAQVSAKNSLSDSLIVVNAGTNDLLRHLRETSLDQLVPLMLSRYETFLKVLYNTGARNFLIVGLTTLGYQPPLRHSTPELGDYLNINVQHYNAGVKKLARELSSKLSGAELLFFDPYNLFVDMINNGPRYGFEDTTSCCYAPLNNFLCKDPSTYLYWNEHPTQQAFQYLAEALWSGDDSMIMPINLQRFSTERGFSS